MKQFLGMAGLACASAFLLSGCGEDAKQVGQATTYKQGKYQGKPDGKPWDNAPLAVGSGDAKWNKGDKVTWETQIKARNDGQNEYKRIGQ